MRIAGWMAAWCIGSLLMAEPPERSFAEVGILSPVLIQVPDSKREAPDLWVCLHGRGGSSENLGTLWEQLKEPRPVAAFPQGPYPLLIGENRLGWSWSFPSRDKKMWDWADPLVVNYILEVVRGAKQKHGCGNVYLFAHSQGVAYAYLAAFREPELFKGVIAFAGPLPLEMLPEAAILRASGKFKVFIAQGRQDPLVPLRTSEMAREFLEKHGFAVKLQVFDGGHQPDAMTLRMAQEWTRSGATR